MVGRVGPVAAARNVTAGRSLVTIGPPEAVACWYVAQAPLHFGSWFMTAAWRRAGPLVPRQGREPGHLRQLSEGCPAMGNGVLAAAAKTGGFNPTDIVFLVLIVLVFYMLILRPQRRRQQRAAQTQSAVLPGQQVRTTAGIYGTVVSADDQDVIVQIAPGVEIRMMRRAILDVVPDDMPPDPDSDGPSEPEPHPDDARSDDWDSPDRNI
jgi:preprotein translocase subunit YajC